MPRGIMRNKHSVALTSSVYRDEYRSYAALRCPSSCACICVSGKPVCKGNSNCPCQGHCSTPAKHSNSCPSSCPCICVSGKGAVCKGNSNCKCQGSCPSSSGGGGRSGCSGSCARDTCNCDGNTCNCIDSGCNKTINCTVTTAARQTGGLKQHSTNPKTTSSGRCARDTCNCSGGNCNCIDSASNQTITCTPQDAAAQTGGLAQHSADANPNIQPVGTAALYTCSTGPCYCWKGTCQNSADVFSYCRPTEAESRQGFINSCNQRKKQGQFTAAGRQFQMMGMMGLTGITSLEKLGAQNTVKAVVDNKGTLT